MTETTVESIFGVNAGIVWEALKEKGPCNIADLARTTSLSREEVHGALGWLGRENKISMEMQGKPRGRRARIFSLQP
jgi:predicted ArsR family transcriptional regulator